MNSLAPTHSMPPNPSSQPLMTSWHFLNNLYPHPLNLGLGFLPSDLCLLDNPRLSIKVHLLQEAPPDHLPKIFTVPGSVTRVFLVPWFPLDMVGSPKRTYPSWAFSQSLSGRVYPLKPCTQGHRQVFAGALQLFVL